MRFQRTIPHQIDVSRSKYVYMRAVRRSYGHSKHNSQFGGLRMRLNVSTRVPTEVTTFFLTVGSTVIEVQVKVKDGVE